MGDNYVGNVALFRIIGSKGDIVSIGVYDRRNKRDVLKGHLQIRLIGKHKK